MSLHGLLADKELEQQIATLSQNPDNIANLRYFHEALSEKLEATGNPTEFILGLFYHYVTLDILRNCAEDDALQPFQIKRFIDPLIASWRKAHSIETSELGSPDGWEAWGATLASFGREYQRLPQLRGKSEHVVVQGVKFLTAVDGAFIPGIPNSNEIEPLVNDLTSWMFPDLDATLADPATNYRVAQWYVDAVANLVLKLESEGQRLDSICTIEKTFSVTGAIALTAHLVNQLGLPATIYRVGYWNEQTRLTGIPPVSGQGICLVYDVAISGRVLLRVARFLRDRFGVHVLAAVVLYTFEAGAREALADEGITLISFLDQATVRDQLTQAVSVDADGKAVISMPNSERLPIHSGDPASRSIETVEEAIAHYRGEWVLMKVTEKDEREEPVRGYVLAHSPSRDVVSDVLDNEPRRSHLPTDEPRQPYYTFKAFPRVRSGPEFEESMAQLLADFAAAKDEPSARRRT